MELHPHLFILHKVLHCIQNFLRTGDSQYLELQITERNGIEGIVLEGNDVRAVVVRPARPVLCDGNALDLSKIDFGTGKHLFAENGRYISKYQITIPAELADYE